VIGREIEIKISGNLSIRNPCAGFEIAAAGFRTVEGANDTAQTGRRRFQRSIDGGIVQAVEKKSPQR
jgi:hypothetical protein